MTEYRHFLGVFRKEHQESASKELYYSIRDQAGFDIPSVFDPIMDQIEEFYEKKKIVYGRRRVLIKPNWYADPPKHFEALQSGKLGFDEVAKIFYWYHSEYPELSEVIEIDVLGDKVKHLAAPGRKRRNRPSEKLPDSENASASDGALSLKTAQVESVIDNEFEASQNASFQKSQSPKRHLLTGNGGISFVIVFVAIAFGTWLFQLFHFLDEKSDAFEKELVFQGARDNLLRKVTGDTGKGRSLSTLIKIEDGLKNIDLTCSYFNSSGNTNCDNPTIFSDVKIGVRRFLDSDCSTKFSDSNQNVDDDCIPLGPGSNSTYNIIDVSFDGNKLNRWDVDDAYFGESSFKDVRGEGLYFKFSSIDYVKLDGFECRFCGFSEMTAPEGILRSLTGAAFVGGLQVRLSENPPKFSTELVSYYSNPPIFVNDKALASTILDEIDEPISSIAELKRKMSKGILEKLDRVIHWDYYENMAICFPDSHPKFSEFENMLYYEDRETFGGSPLSVYPGEPYFWPRGNKHSNNQVICLSPAKTVMEHFKYNVYAAVLNLMGYWKF